MVGALVTDSEGRVFVQRGRNEGDRVIHELVANHFARHTVS